MSREYPKQPLVGVGGVVIHRNRVLLVKRGTEPLKDQWSIPGGMLELGEALAEGARRELKEETGLDVEPLEVIAVFDRILRNTGRRGWSLKGSGRVRYHYVIVDYLCRLKGGKLAPASDVLAARWVRRENLPEYHLTEMATSVIMQAFGCLMPSQKWKAPGLALTHETRGPGN
jgi:ADP-ribose pyrophosphatase YjhB (NUDIX family)